MEQAAALQLATRMASLEPSATLAMAARAGAMKAEGIDVIDLSVGEPDFPTPSHICAAGAAAIAAGKTKYTPAAGIPALRQAVATDYSRRAGLAVEMVVTAINSVDHPQTEAVLRAAAAAGVKLYRLGYLRYQDQGPIEPQLATMQRAIHNLAQLNERCAITGCYQNHHGGRIMGASIWDLRTILGDLDPAWMGCQYDIRHAVAEATGSWEQGLQIIMPPIRSLALKDFRWRAGRPLSPETVPAGTGLVPWQRYASLISAAEHRVPLTAHCEWPTFSPAEKSLPITQRKLLATERMAAERAFLQTVFSDLPN